MPLHSANDDYLDRLYQILTNIHEKYYKSFKKQDSKIPATIKNVNQLKWSVLRNQTIFFDSEIRLFGPIQHNEFKSKNKSSHWHYDGWWRKGESLDLAKTVVKVLGGKVWSSSMSIDSITHVICPTRGEIEFPLEKFLVEKEENLKFLNVMLPASPCEDDEDDLLKTAEDELEEMGKGKLDYFL